MHYNILLDVLTNKSLSKTTITINKVANDCINCLFQIHERYQLHYFLSLPNKLLYDMYFKTPYFIECYLKVHFSTISTSMLITISMNRTINT
jgi:hypothetical protein